jgi:hypothetical protein
LKLGEILAYDPILHDFVAPHSKITHPEPEENLPPVVHLPHSHPFKISEDYIRTHADVKKATPAVNTVAEKNGSSTQKPGYNYLEPSQADRIYWRFEKLIRNYRNSLEMCLLPSLEWQVNNNYLTAILTSNLDSQQLTTMLQ